MGSSATQPRIRLGIYELRAESTIYQALTDGFALCYIFSNAANEGVHGKTGDATPPVTQRCYATAQSGYLCQITMAVKKGDYWEMVLEGAPTPNKVFWIPLKP